MTTALTRGVVEIPDGHLAYDAGGTGERAVVLLHGGALDRRSWRPQAPRLARDHRVVAVDARGHGESSTPTGPFRLCDDVAAVVEHLGLGPATLVGLSMGAATAVDVAVEHPHLVEAVVISGAATSAPEFRDAAMTRLMDRWAEAARRRDREAWLHLFLQLGLGPGRTPADAPAGVVDAVLAMARDTLEHHVGTDLPVTPDPVTDVDRRARELRVPLMAITGSADHPDHRRMPRELAAAVGGLHLEVPGAGHYPNLEDPGRFTDLLLAFLLDARRPRRHPT